MANSFPPAGGGTRSGNYPRRNVDPFAAIRRNHRIKVPQVRVISPEGKQLGILDTAKAVTLALENGLDLVEVAPNATPPVCRIMDFGKYVYEEQKKHSHVKVRHAEEFLDHGNKVKMRLKFRGREMAHTELGFGVMKRAVTALATMGHPDADPKLIGRNIHVMLTPLPPNKRKPKFHVRSDEEEAANRAEHEDEQRGATDSGSNPPPAKA